MLRARNAEFEAHLSSLIEDSVASRIFERDASLWGEAAAAEASVRLGWTDFEPSARRAIREAETLREQLRDAGVDRVVLCGMGGSSLAPAVIAQWAEVELRVLSSTHPATVARELAGDLARTAVVVSSKSGSTIETASHLTVFEAEFRAAGIDPASRVIVVTDPGSPLETRAREHGFHCVQADPDVGGRFSALTAFGLVPACLAGAPVAELVDAAEKLRWVLRDDSEDNPALVLAAAIAAGLPQRFALGLSSGVDAQWGLGLWIDQLIAESTGKDGVGVLPAVLDDDAPELQRPPTTMLQVLLQASHGDDSGSADLVVSGGLGEQFLLWETATAALGYLLGIDPFNQPDVESAKAAARALLSDTSLRSPSVVGVLDAVSRTALVSCTEQRVPGSFGEVIALVREMVPADGYLAIQAYLDPVDTVRERLRRLRDRLAELLSVPVVLGIGPGYLHSSGQLHKGGPGIGAFLQLCDGALEPLPIPGSENGFDALIVAQARGDRRVLAERGRPVLALQSSSPVEMLDGLLAAQVLRR